MRTRAEREQALTDAVEWVGLRAQMLRSAQSNVAAVVAMRQLAVITGAAMPELAFAWDLEADLLQAEIDALAQSCPLCHGTKQVRWGTPRRAGGEMGPCLCVRDFRLSPRRC